MEGLYPELYPLIAMMSQQYAGNRGFGNRGAFDDTVEDETPEQIPIDSTGGLPGSAWKNMKQEGRGKVPPVRNPELSKSKWLDERPEDNTLAPILELLRMMSELYGGRERFSSPRGLETAGVPEWDKQPYFNRKRPGLSAGKEIQSAWETPNRTRTYRLSNDDLANAYSKFPNVELMSELYGGRRADESPESTDARYSDFEEYPQRLPLGDIRSNLIEMILNQK